MKIGVIGTGYVFDHYMTTRSRHPGLEFAGIFDTDSDRAKHVGSFYGIRVHDSAAALMADPEIEIIANFTPIHAHYEVSLAALRAGKHVYSEKPLAGTMEDAESIFKQASELGLRLSCAPSNALSPTVQTLWAAVEQGTVGDVRLVYAEFDDNPVYLLAPETWRSRSGAPWPYMHEYEMGCTWEHAGYHLSWMCAIFGPVRALTAFSKQILPDKTYRVLNPAHTPDFSVAVLDFESGVVGRLTCSIAAPLDLRMRIIGNRGELSADTYRDYEAPVRLEAFTGPSLKVRNAAMVRRNPLLQWPFGTGGRQVPLIRTPPPGESRFHDEIRGHGPRSWLRRLRRAQMGQQDKCLGLAELADAIATNRPHFPPPDFTLHLTELTLAIQAAGPDGQSYQPKTHFAPLSLPDRSRNRAPDFTQWMRPGPIPRLIGRYLNPKSGQRQ